VFKTFQYLDLFSLRCRVCQEPRTGHATSQPPSCNGVIAATRQPHLRSRDQAAGRFGTPRPELRRSWLLFGAALDDQLDGAWRWGVSSLLAAGELRPRAMLDAAKAAFHAQEARRIG
jgi:hypothetical protein